MCYGECFSSESIVGCFVSACVVVSVLVLCCGEYCGSACIVVSVLVLHVLG